MSEETLYTAARRIVRFIRVDDERNGGLLSTETLARMVEDEERRRKVGATTEFYGENE